MVTPLRVLLLLFYIACITAVIMVLSPQEVKLGEGFTFNIFSTADLWNEADTARKLDMAQFSDIANKVDSVEKINQKQEILTTSATSEEVVSTIHKEKIEPIKDIRFPIQFADSLNPKQLDNFFESLRRIYEDKSLVRIIHYGDSQIEGDRISEYLRTRFQNKFGGCGVGLVPVLEKQAFRSTLTTNHAPNWVRNAIYGNDAPKKKGTFRFGLLASAYRYSPKPNDSLSSGSKTYRSWVSFKETSMQSDPKNTQIENIKILYSSPLSRINTSIKVDDGSDTPKDSALHYSLGYANNFNVFEQYLPAKFKKMTINFESAEGAEIYGVALDCNEGIAVDNVALRGSSGVEFTKIDKEFFRQQIKEMNVKLIIMQFGVNVVPSVLSDYTFYENLFYQQLRYLKAVSPDLNILVVGVSDMAHKKGTHYESYPNIEKIRDSQKRAAFKAGCAFWDLYEAMGGHNSMLSWVNNKPALGNKDFTHFTARGARLVGEMLYNALMKEYDNYKKRMGYEDKLQ